MSGLLSEGFSLKAIIQTGILNPFNDGWKSEIIVLLPLFYFI